MLLVEEGKGRTFLVRLEPGKEFHTHRGGLSHDAIAGLAEGSVLHTHTGHPFLLFRPLVGDRMFKVKRRTQIVYPKDAGWIVVALDLRPGARVLEMGTGSGAMTILLGQLVGPTGRIHTFDRREEFLQNALGNIARAGLADRVEANVLIAGDPFPVQDVDAVFLDLPSPWEAIPAAADALAPGRPLALIVPTAEQLKESVRTLGEAGFVLIEVVELMERPILVRQKEGVRPSERMTAFTGYLVTGRKRFPAIPPADRGA
ncbi:MAG: tRNA (adenine(58)-N(1))-methyltransferase [Candidatus Bipolaricaulis sibiricus]|uniref:tRNA (adenine(58)-N(1))-methyltransferase TrmI n=1 Tax=Bipolaricaulis sibiricus TaxID=2501609 RepID=A0A410FW46_BIPS1|nr:MAG: tRNA (adenine(58)-N(1))-methyltransferase [Candidatus Bipolaricaulis sibiricus]